MNWLHSGFFFGDSREPLSELKNTLEKHIGKLGTTIADLNIQFAVNFMFQNAIRAGSESFVNQPMEQESFPQHQHLTLRRVYRYNVKGGMCAPRALRTPYILCRI